MEASPHQRSLRIALQKIPGGPSTNGSAGDVVVARSAIAGEKASTGRDGKTGAARRRKHF
jgi:hypothetical protein